MLTFPTKNYLSALPSPHKAIQISGTHTGAPSSRTGQPAPQGL